MEITTNIDKTEIINRAEVLAAYANGNDAGEGYALDADEVEAGEQLGRTGVSDADVLVTVIDGEIIAVSDDGWAVCLDSDSVDIGRDEIEQLRDEAGVAGDSAMVADCERALDEGKASDAWAACVEAILDAMAQQ